LDFYRNSLATTANFISWNNVIAADGLLMPSPVCIMSGSENLKLIGPGGYRLMKAVTSGPHKLQFSKTVTCVTQVLLDGRFNWAYTDDI
ncbi:MAG: hypothetical protein SPL86_08345, partial [Succiniclasticum sp.]|uniref:hypothetical protein n=1 Tax=Succiniclasticum sp. TaxID=2775030 RepID=UPI002A91270A